MDRTDKGVPIFCCTMQAMWEETVHRCVACKVSNVHGGRGTLPSGCRTKAMRAERLGSYSSLSTTPGPCLPLLLKSMQRYSRLAPPPLCQEVMVPLLLRPPVFIMPSVKGLKGPPRHKFSRVVMTRPRKPAECGFSHKLNARLYSAPQA